MAPDSSMARSVSAICRSAARGGRPGW